MKTEYVLRQLARTKHKKYELYVVSRIVHQLDDLDIKFVTQQYVSRPERYALLDLFFPQLNLSVEVNEGHHQNQVQADAIREKDIIAVTAGVERKVDATVTIEKINEQADSIVSEIKSLKEKLIRSNNFIPWDINTEYEPATYMQRGYLDVADNVVFRTIADACNCMGHNYKGFQRGGARHPYDKDVLLWFPKLFREGQARVGDWDNHISRDENVIWERHEDQTQREEHVLSHIENPDIHPHKRIVFVRFKDDLGFTLYRFKGLYALDKRNSNAVNGLKWERVKQKVTLSQGKVKVI